MPLRRRAPNPGPGPATWPPYTTLANQPAGADRALWVRADEVIPAGAAAAGQNANRAVTISGGVVTGVQVNSAVNMLSGPGTVIVPANANIALTYTSAPTWVWQLI